MSQDALAFRTATRALEVYTRLREALAALPSSARQAAIDAAVDDPAVRAEVVRLASLSGLTPPDAPSPTSASDLEPGALLGQRYRLIRKVGQGGAGVVWLANQESPVKRQVAIKVLPGEVAGPRAEQRFEAERNALSRMSHPFVASIYDAGRTRSGRLFVVMEFVDGEPIDTYAARRVYGARERAELFARVCRGVHHAHQKGVVHRDLKPGNVLVATHDGVAVPKIIDFGIAKVTTHQVLPKTTLEGFFVGTPEYMSPEQAGVGGGDVDTISDVYSLGVLFYELLTGLLPIHRGSEDQEITDWQRTLATTEPLRPSLRLARAFADKRHVDFPITPRELMGDLDSIVMKAMARERDRRYSSASELAADVERHLAGEPVAARPPSLGYRLGRFVRRHPAAVASTLMLFASTIVATIVIAQFAADRAAERHNAETAQLQAENERALARKQSAIATEMTARSNLATARVAFEVRDAFTAKRALDAIPESLRGWEWRWLRYEIDRSTATSRIAFHYGAVRKLSVLAADSLAISGGDDGTLRLWDTSDLAPLALRQVSAFAIADLAAGEHPLGPVAVVTCREGLFAFDLRTLALLWSRPPGARLSRESLSIDGTRVVVASGERRLTVHDAYTGRELFEITVAEQRVERAGYLIGDLLYYDAGHYTVLLDAQGQRYAVLPGLWPVASAERDRLALRPWNEWHDRQVFSLPVAFEQGWIRGDDLIRTIHLGPDQWSVTSEQASTVTLRRVLDRASSLSDERLSDRILVQSNPSGVEWLRRGGVVLPGHREDVTAIVFSSGGEFVLSAAANGRIKRWEAELGTTPFRVGVTNDVVFGADFSPDGEQLATSGWGVVKLWDTRTGRERLSRWWSRTYITGVAFSPDGHRVVAADWRGDLLVLDSASGEMVARWPGVDAGATAVSWNPAGVFIATRNGEVIRLDPGSGAVSWRRSVHPATPILAMVLAPGNATREPVIYSAGSLEAALPEDTSETLSRTSPHPFVVGLDAPTGAPAKPLEALRGPFSALAISPDGRELVAGHEDGRIAVWNLSNGALRGSSPSVGGRIVALTWTEDLRRIVAAHVTGVVVIVDAQTLAPLLTLPGAPPGVRAMAMTPDAKALLMSGMGAPLVAHEAAIRAEPRARAEEARLRRELDELLSITPGVAAVLARASNPAIRDRALGRGDNPNVLNSAAWAVVRYPGEARANIAFARMQAEVAAEVAPVWQFENTRALARLRDGDPVGALSSVGRSVALQREAGLFTHPTDWATAAMALAALGRRAEAREQLTRALAEAESPAWKGNAEVGAIVEEARRQLSP